MDYGSHLKEKAGNLSRRSKHYRRQSKFEDSDRQIQGKILEVLLEKKTILIKELVNFLENDTARIERIIDDMVNEKLIERERNTLSL